MTIEMAGFLSGIFWAGAVAFAALDQWQEGNPAVVQHTDVGAIFSLFFAAGSVGVAYYAGDLARDESGDDPSNLINTMWILNGVVVVWDILILTHVTTSRDGHQNLVDFTDALQIGMPSISIVDGVPFVGNLMGFTF
jgi:hypothetical protein